MIGVGEGAIGSQPLQPVIKRAQLLIVFEAEIDRLQARYFVCKWFFDKRVQVFVP